MRRKNLKPDLDGKFMEIWIISYKEHRYIQ